MYAEQSPCENPRFFAEHVAPKLPHEVMEGHMRDELAGDLRCVTGDPADMLLGTKFMDVAFQSRYLVHPKGRLVRNPIYYRLQEPWREVVPPLLHASGLLLNPGDPDTEAYYTIL